MLAKGRPRSPSCAESVASAPQSQLCSTKRAMRAASSGGGMAPPAASSSTAAVHRSRDPAIPHPSAIATDCRAPQTPAHTHPAPRGEGRTPQLSANRNKPARLPSPMRARRGQPCECEITLSAVSQRARDACSPQPMRAAGRRGLPHPLP